MKHIEYTLVLKSPVIDAGFGLDIINEIIANHNQNLFDAMSNNLYGEFKTDPVLSDDNLTVTNSYNITNEVYNILNEASPNNLSETINSVINSSPDVESFNLTITDI